MPGQHSFSRDAEALRSGARQLSESRFHASKRPVAIARLLHALFREAEAAHEFLHFLERQGSMERLRKKLPLLWVRTSGIGSNEMLKVFQCIWPKQIANE